MPTTSNFGWTTPADTDLVKDGAAAIRTLGNGIDTSLVDLKGGTTGQILSKASNTDLDYTWINNDQGDITEVQAGTGISVASGTGPVPVVTNTVATTFDAKGDLVVGTGADTFAKLTVGTNGHTLVADSSTSTGLKWAAASSGALTLIKTGTFSNVANTGTTFDSVFSSTYLFYVIKMRIQSTSGNQDVFFQLRNAGSTRSANYFGMSLAYYSSATGTLTQSAGASEHKMGRASSNVFSQITVNLAHNSSNNIPTWNGNFMSGANNEGGIFSCLVDNGATDGFILSLSANNINGDIAVYGLAKS